eukprot:CAMPEP_0172311816 /NCGR_PEP_ID=MMETSP1058-20130122/15787_1 /TAXON_ID=83371 /ORGANISM="Detonula confervacea, Strain CCMP 353" /LENGTH=634 /DNA_ID=CAMNT_0013025109 /DNA_START=147 /DNA_END=2051 /DNA_ORIENTATION=+
MAAAAAAAASSEQQVVPASPGPAPAQSSLPTNTTEWPNAAPLNGEKLIFSISCGNSHLHWATHYGDAEDYNPQIFWRTPHLKKEDMESEDLLAVLSRNLPDDPHDHIFGKAENATAADAQALSKLRAAPLISVYVVSTNQSQEALLAAIWKTVPSRFFVMRGDDFFKKEEGRYDTMGTDRLATLTGAVHLHGHPALVFDGGTATTYSATDGNGKILGGGIGPGLQSKFRSLTKDTDALPEITTDQVIARVNEAQEKGKPLPTFARNTQEAMMADAFQEFALKGRNVIGHWLEKAHEKSASTDTMKVNTDRHVICTGGDSDILMQLLQPHYGGVIEHMESSGAKSKNGALAQRYKVEMSKHLIHYGIACVLATQVSLRNRKDAFRKNPHQEHVGKRVAKHFEVEADDGDNIFRGDVVKVIETDKEDEFRIQYDDGDSEDITIGELYDLFKMFAVHGEKKSKKAATGKGKSTSQKKKGATQKEKKKEKPISQAATQKEKATSQTAASDKENTKEVKSSPEKKAVDIPSFPIKSAKNKASRVPSDAKKPAAKKSKTVNDVVALVKSSDPRSFVRKRIGKDFDGDPFFGTIMEYDDTENPPLWHVEYDDGDEEDYSKKDLIKALKYYGIEGKNDDNKS